MKPSERIAALTHDFKNLEPASRWARATVLYADEQHAVGHQRERECVGLIGTLGGGDAVMGPATSIEQLRNDLDAAVANMSGTQLAQRLSAALDELAAWRAL